MVKIILRTDAVNLSMGECFSVLLNPGQMQSIKLTYGQIGIVVTAESTQEFSNGRKVLKMKLEVFRCVKHESITQ